MGQIWCRQHLQVGICSTGCCLHLLWASCLAAQSRTRKLSAYPKECWRPGSCARGGSREHGRTRDNNTREFIILGLVIEPAEIHGLLVPWNLEFGGPKVRPGSSTRNKADCDISVSRIQSRCLHISPIPGRTARPCRVKNYLRRETSHEASTVSLEDLFVQSEMCWT